MKHLLKLIITVCLVFCLTACGENREPAAAPAAENAAETAAVQTTAAPAATEAQTTAAPAATEAQTEASAAATTAVPSAGMANPMVEADSTAIGEQLGIHIDAGQIDPGAKCFIIGGKLAHIVWTQKNVNNEDVELVLRATKDAELAPAMHGIHDADMSEPVVTEVPLTEEKQLELTFTEAKTEKVGIYTWKDGQIFYSLTYDGDMSQMALAEILDSIVLATGIRYHKENITALPGISELSDCIVNAYFDKTQIRNENGVYIMKCECYEEEYFDMVEIHLMQEGDTITVDGDEVIEIRTIERRSDSGDIVLNGGIDSADGVVLSPAGGGTYRVRGWDDCPSYRFLDEKEFELLKDVVLTDTADIDNRCVEKKAEGDEAVVKHIMDNEYIDPPARGCRIRLEGGKIAEIAISYVP